MKKVKILTKLEQLERQILLNLPLNCLPLNLESAPFKKAVFRLKRDILNKRLNFFPHIWVSTDWFCPDGSCGVAVPFYLFNPTLMSMEKEKMGFVEGENYDQILKLLRHETGHAFENLYGTRSHPLRKAVFGHSKSKTYPASYKPRVFSNRYIHHLGEGYAQSHPDEDFAETFATWLAYTRQQWQYKYRTSKHVLQKLSVIENLVKYSQSRSPLKSCTYNEYEPIQKEKKTLKAYFQEKARRLKPSLSLEARKVLKDLKPSSHSLNRSYIYDLDQYFKKNKSKMIQDIASSIGIYQYQASQLLKPLEKEVSQLSPMPLENDKQVYSHLLDTATLVALEGLRLRKDRVYL